ncbi:MAG: hypothetical protein WAV09_04815 [Minisyncoccia bacterium]
MEHDLLAHILRQPFQTLVLTGNVQDVIASIETFFTHEENISIYSHGDVAVHILDSVPIDTARDIKVWIEGMPQYRTHKLLLIAPTLFPIVSQNALLKTLEEPSGNTQIILIIKDLSILLPTILSRAVVYAIPQEKKKYDNSLLKFVPHERLAHGDVAILLKTGLQKPTKEKVSEFFENIVGAVLQSSYSRAEKKEAIQVLSTVTPYIQDQGASVKMLIEYVCLRLPLLKG